MKTNSKNLLLTTLIYIYLPLAIFMLGFCAWYVWLITFGVCGYILKHMYDSYRIDDDIKETVTISPVILAISLVIIIALCIIMGFGGIFIQAGDWGKHNALLHDLTDMSWPVIYTENEKALLTYYIGQYMIPTLIGKIGASIFGSISNDVNFGFNISAIAMSVWGAFGLYIAYLNLIRLTRSNTKLKQIRTLIIMFFFCGALILAQSVLSGIYKDDMYSVGAHHWLLCRDFHLQYRSNFVMLRWTYPQVIVIWLISMLFLMHKKRVRYYVILIAPVLMYGTFSVLFLALAAISLAVYEVLDSKERKKTIKEIFGFENFGAFLTMGFVFIAYFLGYLQVDKPSALRLRVHDININSIFIILVFDFFMFGIYAICVYKEQKNNILYYTVIAFLTVLPIFSMGLYNDLVMGASIPALFFLMTYVIETLNKKKETREYGLRSGIIIFTLLIGMWYPVMEIRDIVDYGIKDGGTLDVYGTLGRYADRYSDEGIDLIYNYFTYDTDGKLFYEYLMRKDKAGKNKKDSVSGIFFDTYINIKVFDETPADVLDAALDKCREYELIFSKTDENSELYRINHRIGGLEGEDAFTAIISEDMYNVLRYAIRYANETQESFNPALGSVIDLWDFKNDEKVIPDHDLITDALNHTDHSKIEVFTRKASSDNNDMEYLIRINDEDLMLDLGGIAKGYIADELRTFLCGCGCSEAVISLGGNITCIGNKQGKGYKIGIQKPFEAQGITATTVNVGETSVVTSGIYERYFERNGRIYHHIIDTKTGFPAENNIASVTIVCRDSMKADALSTALLCMGYDGAEEYLKGQTDVRAIFIFKDGSISDIHG
jgi:thiamine biosynthesis lipoprotein ApbE